MIDPIDQTQKHKECLRCKDVNTPGGKVPKKSVQAAKFRKSHKDNEIEQVLAAFKTEAMADILDFLIIEDAMLETNRRYRHYSADLVVFIEELRKIQKKK